MTVDLSYRMLFIFSSMGSLLVSSAGDGRDADVHLLLSQDLPAQRDALLASSG